MFALGGETAMLRLLRTQASKFIHTYIDTIVPRYTRYDTYCVIVPWGLQSKTALGP